MEPIVRLTAFVGVLAVMVAWEAAAARRRLSTPKGRRWLKNFAIVAIDTAVARVLFPVAAVGVATAAAARGWGLLNVVPLPMAWSAVISVVFLDFVIYLQHRAFHVVPPLWRVHRMHHTDLDIDVSTALRFHPIEIVLSMLIKMAAVAAIGAPPGAVIAFEVLLNASAMFNHGNVRMPLALDRVLRWVLVTPDMHRVHHSVVRSETDSNYGFCLPWWDRLLGSYCPQPAAGHEAMTIGLETFREAGQQTLLSMLANPFRAETRA